MFINKNIKVINNIQLVLLLILLILINNVLSQDLDKEKLKESIDTFVANADEKFDKTHNRFVNLKKNKDGYTREIFLFTLNNNYIERLTIEFINEDNSGEELSNRYKESETYYFDDKKVVFATESVASYEADEKVWEDRWNVSMHIYRDEIISMSSVGHGKTEDDNWDPKPHKLSRKRINELKKHIKKIR